MWSDIKSIKLKCALYAVHTISDPLKYMPLLLRMASRRASSHIYNLYVGVLQYTQQLNDSPMALLRNFTLYGIAMCTYNIIYIIQYISNTEGLMGWMISGRMCRIEFVVNLSREANSI